jgi:hypothetical protein
MTILCTLLTALLTSVLFAGACFSLAAAGLILAALRPRVVDSLAPPGGMRDGLGRARR